MFIKNYGDMKIGNFQQYLISPFQNLLCLRVGPGEEKARIDLFIIQDRQEICKRVGKGRAIFVAKSDVISTYFRCKVTK